MGWTSADCIAAPPPVVTVRGSHADAAMTSHYTHIEAQAHRSAAEAVAKLVSEA